MSDSGDLTRDPWAKLREFTQARIGLGRAGDAMPTQDLLTFQLDHAHARNAVKGSVDFTTLARRIGDTPECLHVHSAAADRATYIRRPDLGRRLDERSRTLVAAAAASAARTAAWDVVFVIADGLSSVAIQSHAVPVLHACLERLRDWKIAPVVLAAQARVALGDEVCRLMNAQLCVVLIGERPGLSVGDSLGLYMTWRPTPDHRDADRNCISNIHAHGLTYTLAAEKLCWLLSQARTRQLSGVSLKENAPGSNVLHASRHSLR